MGTVCPILRAGRNGCQRHPRRFPGRAVRPRFRAVIQHSFVRQQNGHPIYPPIAVSARYKSLVFELLARGNDTIRHTCGFSF
jgi:hypothetical protein